MSCQPTLARKPVTRQDRLRTHSKVPFGALGPEVSPNTTLPQATHKAPLRRDGARRCGGRLAAGDHRPRGACGGGPAGLTAAGPVAPPLFPGLEVAVERPV